MSEDGSPRHQPDLHFHRAQSYPLSSHQRPTTINDTAHSSTTSPQKQDAQLQLPLSSVQTDRGRKGDAGAGLIKRTPIYTTPLPGRHEMWHLEENLSIDWGALFYDLVLVAALSAFTSSHRVATPSDIPSFASYYVILYFIWVSQVFYDIRYEAEDSVHRLFKFFQICVLIYIGSASGNWAPDGLRSGGDERVRDYEGAITRDTEESFTVIVIAFMISRVVLATQYFICACVGMKLRRRTVGFWITICSLLVSSVILIVVAALPSTSKVLTVLRITLLYATIALELLVLMFQVYRQTHVKPDTRKIGERYSAVVLIVLGEGLITLVGAFNDGLAGLSDNDWGTYGQALLSVAIAYLVYVFLFSRFQKTAQTGRKRAIVFELIHFPLTFGLLLLFGAIVNVVIVISHGRGTATMLTNFVKAVEDAARDIPLTDELHEQLGRYLYKMPLAPTFDVVLEDLRELYNADTPDRDPSIVYLQYLGQIIGTSFTLYDIEFTQKTALAFLDLVNVNATWSPDAAVRQQRVAEATDYVFEVNSEPFTMSLSGTLWLFPVAGIVLILCSLRSLCWSHTGTPLATLIIVSFHLTGGLVLGLLGLLGIGDKSFDVGQYAEGNTDVLPMYDMTLNQVPLLIVTGVYLFAYITPTAVLEIVDRYKEPVFRERNVGWWRRLGYMTMGI